MAFIDRRDRWQAVILRTGTPSSHLSHGRWRAADEYCRLPGRQGAFEVGRKSIENFLVARDLLLKIPLRIRRSGWDLPADMFAC